MKDQYEITKILTIIQSYFIEKVSTYYDKNIAYISLDDKKTQVILSSNYEDIVMELYIKSGKVDQNAIHVIKYLME